MQVIRNEILPSNAAGNDVFYLQPLSVPSAPWFKCTPIGKNTLSKMMKNCEKAGFSDGYTNHSLKAYGVTTLFQINPVENSP